MQRFNTYPTAPVPSGGSDWQAEINGSGQTETRSAGDARSWQSPEGSEYVTLPGGQMMPMGNMPGMRTDLPEEMIQNPLSVEYSRCIRTRKHHKEWTYDSCSKLC